VAWESRFIVFCVFCFSPLSLLMREIVPLPWQSDSSRELRRCRWLLMIGCCWLLSHSWRLNIHWWYMSGAPSATATWRPRDKHQNVIYGMSYQSCQRGRDPLGQAHLPFKTSANHRYITQSRLHDGVKTLTNCCLLTRAYRSVRRSFHGISTLIVN